jgi:hypothetical protein
MEISACKIRFQGGPQNLARTHSDATEAESGIIRIFDSIPGQRFAILRLEPAQAAVGYYMMAVDMKLLLANAIKQQRSALGISQEELAARLRPNSGW